MMFIHNPEQTTPSQENRLPTYKAETLVQNQGQAHIVLGDQIYTLRITRAGKLILTK